MLCTKKILVVQRKYELCRENMFRTEKISAIHAKICSVHPIFAGFLEKELCVGGNKIINKRFPKNAC
jgi:hypothetical protein